MKLFLKIVGALFALLVFLVALGSMIPAPEKPELLAIATIGCVRQDAAVALARALSSGQGNRIAIDDFAQQQGCLLVPAGKTVIVIEEEAGHSRVTKVSVDGRELYVLGMPRPTSDERLNSAISDLKRATHELVSGH